MSVEAVIDRLLSHRLPLGEEAEFQRAVATVLTTGGYTVEREYDLGAGRGRIDVYIRSLKIGLELKVKGSRAAVAAQLQRYAGSAEIDALVLVTARASLGAMPRTLGGKPVYVAAIWKGLL